MDRRAQIPGVTIGGVPAVRAVFEKRPHDLQRLALTKEMFGALGDLCSYLAHEHRSYSEKPYGELSRMIARSDHGGVIAEVLPLTPPGVRPGQAEQWQKHGQPILIARGFADNGECGRFLKVAAAFGVEKIVLDEEAAALCEDGHTITAAEGAYEDVKLFRAGKFPGFLKSLRPHFMLIGVGGDAAGKPDLGKPLRAPGRPPALFFHGSAMPPDPKLMPLCEYKTKLPAKGIPRYLEPATECSALLTWLL